VEDLRETAFWDRYFEIVENFDRRRKRLCEELRPRGHHGLIEEGENSRWRHGSGSPAASMNCGDMA
jgi:hypothetical protein